VSIGAAWPINHERVTVPEVLFGAVTLTAVGFVVRGPRRRAGASSEADAPAATPAPAS